MKDILQDIVAHTHALGFLNIVKVNGDDAQTGIDSMAEDRSVILQANTKAAQVEMKGTFGMPNLNKLDIHLKCPEYKDGATIDVVTADRNGQTIPVGIHFENKAGDFKNDFRLMSQKVIESVEPKLTFNADLPVQFVPTINAMQRFKYQVSAHPDEKNVEFNIENGVVRCTVGDASSHSGTFMFHNEGIDEKSRYTFSVPSAYVLAALNMDGDKSIKMGSLGVMITVDSGLISYDYIIPMVSK